MPFPNIAVLLSHLDVLSATALACSGEFRFDKTVIIHDCNAKNKS